MKISQVLKEKLNQEIYSVKADDTIETAAAKLSELRIGTLVVLSSGNDIEGIISERDIVRDLGVAGNSCLVKTVGELMTSDVKTVTPDVDTRTAAKIMTKGRFRHLPVVDGGKLIGVISIGDVVNARLNEMESENQALNDMITGAAF